MTQVSITPTGDSNADKAPAQAIDNMGNPIDDKGNPIDPKSIAAPEGEGETVESLSKALKDTKAELTKLQQAANKELKDGPPAANDGEATPNDAEKAVNETGLDFSKYSTELNDAGELSEDSYKELQGKGFSKDIVDDYIKGQQARVNEQTREVASVVGGEQNLTAVLTWAAENLSPEEIGIYNTSVKTGTAAAKLALEGIHARYVAANGKNPTLINSGTPSTSSDVFKSSHEMTKAMEDKRYWNDPDYQKEVQEKAQRSQRAGTI